jgi:hypothetical protein
MTLGSRLNEWWHTWVCLSSRHSDLIANPVQVRANVDLSLLRGVPPVITAIAMAAAHCFVGAINCFLGRHNVNSKRSALRALHLDLTAQKSGCVA